MTHNLSGKITMFISNNSNIRNADDLEKINYALETILNEILKGIILIILFIILGKLNYFLFSLLILISIRTFSGGFHSKTFLGCLLLTTLYFIITSFVALVLPRLDQSIYYLLSLINILIIIKRAPYPNPFRPIKNTKRRQRLRLLAIFFIILWTLILLFFIDSTAYLNCGVLTIFFQTIQLLIPRKERLYEKKHS